MPVQKGAAITRKKYLAIPGSEKKIGVYPNYTNRLVSTVPKFLCADLRTKSQMRGNHPHFAPVRRSLTDSYQVARLLLVVIYASFNEQDLVNLSD
jgi:hypothetical protein